MSNLSCFRIHEIEPNAVMSTAAKIEIVGNEITSFNSSGFVLNNWNRIIINDNIIKNLHAHFIEANTNVEIERFSFKGNEIYHVENGALSFLSHVPEEALLFDDNFFNQSCDCNMREWLEDITNSSKRSKVAMDTSFCIVNEFLSKCYSLPEGIINIQNFTDRTCSNFTKCEPYKGVTKVVHTARKTFENKKEDVDHRKWFVAIIGIVGCLLVAIIATFIILILRGNRRLKGCFLGSAQYNNDEFFGNEDEGTVVTVADNEKLQLPDELTLEFLQTLSQRLDDPTTHQEASEMIERLYEMFIVDDSYENNNRDDDAHLYEELGNLNLQIPPPPYEDDREQNSRSILKLMEDKIHSNTDEQGNGRPPLVSEYSEPNDAAVHFYSEIKNKSGKPQMLNSSNSSSPCRSMNGLSKSTEPGPSTKF